MATKESDVDRKTRFINFSDYTAYDLTVALLEEANAYNCMAEQSKGAHHSAKANWYQMQAFLFEQAKVAYFDLIKREVVLSNRSPRPNLRLLLAVAFGKRGKALISRLMAIPLMFPTKR